MEIIDSLIGTFTVLCVSFLAAATFVGLIMEKDYASYVLAWIGISFIVPIPFLVIAFIWF